MARVRISSSTSRLLTFVLRPLLRPVPMQRWLRLLSLRTRVEGRRSALLLLAFILFGVSTPTRAQTHYASGQDVVAVFEGWERNPDGSFNMVFGYMNRN